MSIADISKNSVAADAPGPEINEIGITERIVMALSNDYHLDQYYLYFAVSPIDAYIILNISVVAYQFEQMLSVVLPLLVSRGIYFRAAKDILTAKYIAAGVFGYGELGKVLSIRVSPGLDIGGLISELMELTAEFVGPEIPGEERISSIIYSPRVQSKEYPGTQQPDLNAGRKLRGVYKLIKPLKVDVKGSVFLASYRKDKRTIKCVVKEGRRHMWSDEFGRDIFDIIRSQYKLHQLFYGLINIPKPIDLFEEGDSVFMVIEFISGPPLYNKITQIYKNRMWFELSRHEQLVLLSYLKGVVEVVHSLNHKGIVHRDITPANFLVNRQGQICGIDLELAYDQSENVPHYTGGTTGFMPPQQIDNKTPCLADDVYGLAALMIVIFTNLPPVKFLDLNREELVSSLTFFTRDSTVATLIAEGFAKIQVDRPSMLNFETRIYERINHYQRPLIVEPPSRAVISQLISKSIDGLTLQRFNIGGAMLGTFINVDSRINNLKNAVMQGGGLAVPLNSILAAMALCGDEFSGSLNKVILSQTVQFKKEFSKRLHDLSPGLFEGKAGLGLAIAALLKYELSDDWEAYGKMLLDCFTQITPNPDLAYGMAGQGLALLFCSKLLDEDCRPLLSQFIDGLMRARNSNGTWEIDMDYDGETRRALGLANGVSGIIYFLLHYYEFSNESDLREVITETLTSLKIELKRQKWIGSRRDFRPDLSLMNGVAGVALVYIMSYKLFGDPEYLDVAEALISNLPHRPNIVDYTMASGLSGWGMVYLSAYEVTNTNALLESATWIVNVLINTCNIIGEKGYWNVDGVNNADASVLTGTAGVTFFLIKYREVLNKFSPSNA